MSNIQIREVRGRALVEGCALLARSLAFSDRDALPPWLVQTSAEAGGIALGAFDGDRLVGFSFAMPGAERELWSCGLAVDPRCRGRGVGRRLKLIQRECALSQGATVIRWTADPLAAPALVLYLHSLRARIVAYASGLYAQVRPAPVEPDDVVIEWPLPPACGEAGPPSARVEIPLDRHALATPEVTIWRLDVRRAMTQALANGGVGTDVAVDHSAGRAWVLFRGSA